MTGSYDSLYDLKKKEKKRVQNICTLLIKKMYAYRIQMTASPLGHLK
jgi:hypothetical protein